MKKCPFCAEQIQDEAVKCRYCGEFLDDAAYKALLNRQQPQREKQKWFFSTSVIVIAILCVGPFALPLVWFNPKYTTFTKLWVTVVVVAGTLFLSYLSALAYKQFMDSFKALGM